jgi:hypothetical protein
MNFTPHALGCSLIDGLLNKADPFVPGTKKHVVKRIHVV